MAKARGLPLCLGFLLALFILAQSNPPSSTVTRTYAEVVKQGGHCTGSGQSDRGARVTGCCQVTRRRVVIDGCNVAVYKIPSSTDPKVDVKIVDWRRLLTAVRYFTYRDFEVTVVLPHRYRTKGDADLLGVLENIMYATTVYSSKKDDDETILDEAAEHGAAIISCDQYKKWLGENKTEWNDAINRRISFKFEEDHFIPKSEDKRKLYCRRP